MPAPLSRLLRASAREWRDLVRAQWALLTAEFRLRREPVGRLVGRDTRVAPDARPPSGDPDRAHAIATAVRRASRHGIFRPYCLVQSLALRELLEREGIDGSTIRVGVRRGDDGFQAHAWVRWGEFVLGDDAAHVARYTEVNDLRVLGRG